MDYVYISDDYAMLNKTNEKELVMLSISEMGRSEADLILHGNKRIDHCVVSTAGSEILRAAARHVLSALEHGPADMDIVAEQVEAELRDKNRIWSVHVVIGAMIRQRKIPYTSCRLIRRGNKILIEKDWFAGIAKVMHQCWAYYLRARGHAVLPIPSRN
jgi:hypothetical protein